MSKNTQTRRHLIYAFPVSVARPLTCDRNASFQIHGLSSIWGMNTLANIIWLIFGGLWAALGYVVGGFLLCCTIIGIPFGLQCFKIAAVVLWPFGKEIVSSSRDTGCLSLLFNIIWIFC